jgi:2-methylcitrate dehydratase PrpD
VTATARLAELTVALRSDALPATVLESARCHLLYNLACGLAAPGAAAAACAVTKGLRPREATVLDDGTRVPAESAAFANAVLLHARAQDDTHLPSECHPGAVVIPVALALAEQLNATPQAFLAAMVAGYEVTGAVGEPIAHEAIGRGFRASMVFGTLGAAATAGSLMGLDAAEIANAISLSTSLSGGLGQSWIDGSSEWVYHMGAAARNGILAARLAAAGERGARNALEGSAGFMRAFGGREDWQPPADWGLGERFRICEVIYKPYPVCNVTQNPVALAIDLATTHDIRPTDVTAIRLALNPTDRANPGTLNRGPFDGVASTLMSAPYCVAMALVQRSATLSGLHAFEDPAIARLVTLVEVSPDERLASLGARLELDLVDGRTLAAEASADTAALAGDWRTALATAQRLGPEMRGGGTEVEALADVIRRLDELPTLAPLVRAATALVATRRSAPRIIRTEASAP